MSFSSDVKKELNKNSNLSNKEIVKYELIGYLISGNIDLSNSKIIKFSTESDYNINRFAKLLSNLNIKYKIQVIGKSFIVEFKIKELPKVNDIEKIIEISETTINIIDMDKLITEKEEYRKALVRGTFMGGGSMNNPLNEYHLELGMKSTENLEAVRKIILKFNIETKVLESQGKYFLYLKDGEEISNFLALIGANKSVLLFEDIRIQKEMRGKVNRLVNCKAANLNKTINASVEQIYAIKKLKESGKFNKLDENLKEIANLRLENPDMPLIELGKLLKNPIGKSGVNYRLKKIMEIANE